MSLMSQPRSQDDVRRTIGRNLRYLRMELGLRQADVAVLVGVSRKHVAAWETGRKRPGLANLERAADVLGAPSTGWLIDEHEEAR